MMNSPQGQAPLTTLLASAQRLKASDFTKAKKARSMVQSAEWQTEAWEMFDLVGEERYLVTTLANRIAKARFFVGKVDLRNLSAHPEPVEDEQINAVLRSIGRSSAGMAQIVERMSVNLMVAGDGWLAGIPNYILKGEDRPEGSIPLDDFTWRFMSVSEISTQHDGKVRIEIGMIDPITVNPDQVYLIRVWRPHPRKWWEADSATRASLPVLKELVGLTMHVSAQIDSRLAGAGVFIVPASAQQALKEAAGENADDDQFTKALIAAMTAAIQDRGSAAAMVPLVVTAPDEVVDKFKHISFASGLDGSAQSLREESIRRLALGQDAPPEVLLGTAGMNHWGGWLVQEDVVSTHIEPPLALICDALTTQFLWPVLEQLGVEDWEEYVVWYDVSHLIVRPNRGSDAITLHGLGVISDASLREAVGFDESDAPASLEIDDQIAEIVVEMVKANPALISRPGLSVLMEQLDAVMRGVEPEVYDPRKAAAEARAKGENAPQEVDGSGEEDSKETPAPTPTPAPSVPSTVRQGPPEGLPKTDGKPAPVG